MLMTRLSFCTLFNNISPCLMVACKGKTKQRKRQDDKKHSSHISIMKVLLVALCKSTSKFVVPLYWLFIFAKRTQNCVLYINHTRIQYWQSNTKCITFNIEPTFTRNYGYIWRGVTLRCKTWMIYNRKQFEQPDKRFKRLSYDMWILDGKSNNENFCLGNTLIWRYTQDAANQREQNGRWKIVRSY